MGPIRQRVAELHTAVIDLSARLRKGDIDPSWLPKHTFVVLSQIQNHAASVMEDLDVDEAPAEAELDAMDNSLDSMIETYEDIKELIDEALDSFRRSNISVVRKTAASSSEAGTRQTVQLSIGGTDIWRRIVLPGSYRLDELHRIIQIFFGWKDGPYQFTVVRSSRSGEGANAKALNLTVTLEDLAARGVIELLYEYGTRWTVKLMLLSTGNYADSEGSSAESWAERESGYGEGDQIRCVAGAGAAPPEFIDGPVRFRKFLAGLERGNKTEQLMVVERLGGDFDPDEFDLAGCNRYLTSRLIIKNHEPGSAER
jgi:hypothetical protein